MVAENMGSHEARLIEVEGKLGLVIKLYCKGHSCHSRPPEAGYIQLLLSQGE